MFLFIANWILLMGLCSGISLLNDPTTEAKIIGGVLALVCIVIRDTLVWRSGFDTGIDLAMKNIVLAKDLHEKNSTPKE